MDVLSCVCGSWGADNPSSLGASDWMNWWNLEMSRLSAVNQTVIPGPDPGGAGLATRQNRIGACKVVPLPTSLLHLLNLLHCAHTASIITPVIPPPNLLLVCLPGHKHNTFPLILPILSSSCAFTIYHLSRDSTFLGCLRLVSVSCWESLVCRSSHRGAGKATWRERTVNYKGEKKKEVQRATAVRVPKLWGRNGPEEQVVIYWDNLRIIVSWSAAREWCHQGGFSQRLSVPRAERSNLTPCHAERCSSWINKISKKISVGDEELVSGAQKFAASMWERGAQGVKSRL